MITQQTKKIYNLSAGFSFLAFALWLTWPQVLVLGTGLVGGPIAQADGWQNVWNLWWVRTALLQGLNPFYTQLLFWPEGVQLGFQTLNITNALLTSPFLFTAGTLTAYGIAAILGFALTGWLTFRLAFEMTDSLPGALVAGLLVEAAPGHLSSFLDGQLEHVALQWLPLYLLNLFQISKNPTKINIFNLTISFALVIYTSWYQALWIAILTLTFIVWQIITTQQFWKNISPWLSVSLLLTFCLSPLLFNFVPGLIEVRSPVEHWQTQASFNSVDLVDLILPSANHPLWGEAITAYQKPLHPNSLGWITTPGYLALLLGFLGLIWQWPKAKVWGLLTGLLLLFSLGPSLHFNGKDTGIALPFALFSHLPGANVARRPALAAIVALVPLAVLVAFGIQKMHEKLQGWQRLSFYNVILIVGMLEFAPPVRQIFHDDTAPIYKYLRDHAKTLLVVPIDPGDLAYKSAALRAQMTHQRPIIGGYVARSPDYPLIRGVPFIKDLKQNLCLSPDIVPSDVATVYAALAYYQISHIVLHTDRLSPTKLACAQKILKNYGLTPEQREGAILLYRVPTTKPQSFVFLGDGWNFLELDKQHIWRWMKQKGEIYLVNATDQAHYFAINLRIESYKQKRPVAIEIDRRAIGEIMVSSGATRVYSLLVRAEKGQHEIRLTAPTSPDPDLQIARELSLAVETVKITQLP